jgi:hypothetical protein
MKIQTAASSVLKVKDSSFIMKETAGSFETLLPMYEATWRNIPENGNHKIHSLESLKN